MKGVGSGGFTLKGVVLMLATAACCAGAPRLQCKSRLVRGSRQHRATRPITMRFPNPFRRRGDEDGGMVDSGVGIGDGDSVSDGDSVAGGNGERAQMERLREEVDSLRTEVLHINEAVRFTLASQNPRKSSAVGSFVRKAIGVASGAVGDAVAAAMEGAVVDVDAKPSAWTVVLERIDRELGGLSPAEATLLRTAWDETADLWQKSRAELIEFKTKLDEQAGDEASAQAAAQEIEELVEMLALVRARRLRPAPRRAARRRRQNRRRARSAAPIPLIPPTNLVCPAPHSRSTCPNESARWTPSASPRSSLPSWPPPPPASPRKSRARRRASRSSRRRSSPSWSGSSRSCA